MSREVLLLVDALAREKNVEKDVVFAALELALGSATKKRFREDAGVRVAIDHETGDSFCRCPECAKSFELFQGIETLEWIDKTSIINI